ncbi:hypothetical protein, partial [Klebsiella pneumoniae]|uniref:hypothetical protein n=1 Tax=Klebsiella pneumoniae TaxID=573 RepID=UPI002237B058
IGGVIGTGTISNDDLAPTVTVSSPTVVEGATLVHDVTLSNPSSTPTTYSFSLTDGSATAGSDYTASLTYTSGAADEATTGQLTGPAGVTGLTVSYPTTQDNVYEPAETTNLTIGGVIGTGTISNDDLAPT